MTNKQPLPDEYINLQRLSPIEPFESNLQTLNHNNNHNSINTLQPRTSSQNSVNTTNSKGNDYTETRNKNVQLKNDQQETKWANESEDFCQRDSYLTLQDGERCHRSKQFADADINLYDAIIYEEPSILATSATRRRRRKRIIRHTVLLLLVLAAVSITGVIIWRLAFKTNDTTEKESKEKLLEKEDLPPPLPPSALCNHLPTQLQCRQAFIRQMTVEAFSAYQQYVWGAPEFCPLTLEPFSGRLSPYPGETIVDAMVTLWLMDLKEQWQAGRDWIENMLHFADLDYDIRLREALIDYLGGLLSAYTISGDHLFLNKSIAVASAMTPAYNPATGMLPYQYNAKLQKTIDASNFIANIGFQQPELIYLANLTKNDGSLGLANRLVQIRSTIHSMERPYGGLYLTKVHSATGAANNTVSSMFGVATDFYYNMLRSYIQLGRRDRSLLEMYTEAVEANVKMDLFKTMRSSTGHSHLYHRSYNTKTHLHNFGMDESGCLLGALFALGARELMMVNSPKHTRHWQLAVNITETCYYAANATRTKMLPTEFMLNKITDPEAYLTNSLPEAYFILWRTTGDVKYRERSWELALSLYRYSRTASGGYTDLKNVNSAKLSAVEQKNYQRAMLFSGTFRYLYLIFGNDSVFSLDDWFFNSRGHPLPICGHHKHYPKEICEPTLIDTMQSSFSTKNSLDQEEPQNETETNLMLTSSINDAEFSNLTTPTNK